MANKQLDKLLDEINSQLDEALSQIDFDYKYMVYISSPRLDFKFHIADTGLYDYCALRSYYGLSNMYAYTLYCCVGLKNSIAIPFSDMISYKINADYGDETTKLKYAVKGNTFSVTIPEGLLNKYNVKIDDLTVIRDNIRKRNISNIFNNNNNKFINALREYITREALDYVSELNAKAKQSPIDFIKQFIPLNMLYHANVKHTYGIKVIDINLGTIDSDLKEAFKWDVTFSNDSVEIAGNVELNDYGLDSNLRITVDD